MNFLRSKTGKVVIAAVVLLALFLVRPGAGGLRNRIARSISLAIGRPVEIASVSVRLLPRPGFDLQGFVVYEESAFGAEPMLRADEVTAALRLTSLLRGRLEIARLTLTEPSLNLVQDSTGHWNLENLLERSNLTPVAPTGKSKREPRPGFPYIEADDGRINFKIGQEKKPYALTSADFAIWQDSENTWGMRLKAQPVRTDFDLSDTGIVAVNGLWQRAASLRDTPVQFSLQWTRAQLGQASKLAYGRDLGWRGTIDVEVALSGTPGDLAITTSDSVSDFRRYDLADGEALRLAAQCDAHYSSVDRSMPRLSCEAPVGGGFLRVDGSIGAAVGVRGYDLALLVQHVPMQALVALAKHTKKDIPEDLIATGSLDAAFKFGRKAEAREIAVAWTGEGKTRSFAIGSAFAKTALTLGEIPFTVSAGTARDEDGSGSRTSPAIAQLTASPHLEIGPFNLALGRPAPAVAHALLSSTDYSLQISGDAQIKSLLQVARAVGLPALQPAADGIARVDLQIAGPWSAFMPAKAVGSAQLQMVHAAVRGLNEPLEIASANVVLSPDGVQVKNLTASLAGTVWRGSLELPRGCAGAGTCPIGFDLHADTVATDALSQLLTPNSGSRPWYRFLSGAAESRSPYLLTALAHGRIAANRVMVHKLAASHVTANLDVANGVVQLSELRGEVLGGKHVGDWMADFTGKTPAYSGSGSLQRIALAQLAEAMQDSWITGTATATYKASASGSTAAELVSSTKASMQVEAFAGMLPHIVLATGTLAASTAALRMHSFAGRLELRDRKIEVQDGKLETADGVYQVSGTAALTRTLDLNFMRDDGHGFNITGSLTEPKVAEAGNPLTRAALKP